MDSEYITPETALEARIIGDPEWQQGVAWGKPRHGHSEGNVKFHIVAVLHNIEKLPKISPEERAQLRLIALLHDTFKYKVDITKPRVGKNNHAVIARDSATKYVEDPVVLDIIELHDEAFNAWRIGNDTGKWEKAQQRLDGLLEKLGKERLPLYAHFYQCDNETGDKDQACVQWFMNTVKEIMPPEYT